MKGRAKRRRKPRKRLPASMAMSMKYGNELREIRRVPSRSAATDLYGLFWGLHCVIGGNFDDAIFVGRVLFSPFFLGFFEGVLCVI